MKEITITCDRCGIQCVQYTALSVYDLCQRCTKLFVTVFLKETDHKEAVQFVMEPGDDEFRPWIVAIPELDNLECLIDSISIPETMAFVELRIGSLLFDDIRNVFPFFKRKGEYFRLGIDFKGKPRGLLKINTTVFSKKGQAPAGDCGGLPS